MGVFIAIEGSDGSGKATQALELELRAIREGYDVLKVSFPNYGSSTGRFVEHYLSGRYGPARDIHPELASMLYAVDRYASSQKIRDHLEMPHGLVVADRYVASNLAHQGTKYSGVGERRAFYKRILELEYDVLGLPRPDLSIILTVPATTAQANIELRAQRAKNPETRDSHERDDEHLEKATANYLELATVYPDDFYAIPCMNKTSTAMRSIDDIAAEVWSVVSSIAN